MATLGENIRKRREELNLTQEELAKKLGYKSKSTINKIENGTNDITQSKIKAFADALETTTADLMGWTSSVQFDSGYEAHFTTEESEYLSLYNIIRAFDTGDFEQHVKEFKKEYKKLRLKFKNIDIRSLNNFLEFIQYNFPKTDLRQLGDFDTIKEFYEDVINYTEFSLKKILSKTETPDYIQPVAAHLDGELTDEVKDFIDKF
ncbi:MAG: helix-turn-helix transcriptional regulator [Rikenellaceae bacterium]